MTPVTGIRLLGALAGAHQRCESEADDERVAERAYDRRIIAIVASFEPEIALQLSNRTLGE
jgi:hypothetical protein